MANTGISWYIGIDPGTITGVAFWYPNTRGLELHSGSLIAMYRMLWDRLEHTNLNIFIRIEDARLRKWYGKNSLAKAQGAGSIKRDCSMLEEICEYHNWNYELVHPIKGGTKWKATTFKAATGYPGRTNEHERDAAMLVYNLGERRV